MTHFIFMVIPTVNLLFVKVLSMLSLMLKLFNIFF